MGRATSGADVVSYVPQVMSAFFKGAGANILRGAGGALVLVGYDKIKEVLNPK